MNSRERVIRAVKFQHPDRTPIYCFNRDFDRSDILCFDVKPAKTFVPREPGDTEWGYVWQKLDETMGQPREAVIKDYTALDRYMPPDAFAEGRLEGLSQFCEQHRDKYIMVGPDITGFTIVTFLRGFEDTMTDLYLEEENIGRLMDMVFGYEENLIRNICQYDVQAVAFHDDWGTQTACFISPEKWREVFKPRYKKQFDLIHSHNKQVFFHSCGYVWDLIDDLIEIGADILNFNQPEVMGVEKLSEKYRGKACFNCPVDLQKVAIRASREEIFAYTRKLYDCFGGPAGGFIGYVEEYGSIGLSEENYLASLEALENLPKNPDYKKN